MPNLSKTNVCSIVEQAIQKQLLLLLPGMSCPVYISDTNEVKEVMPYIVLHGDRATEKILGPMGQGMGIFEVDFSVMFRSHAKPDSAETRQAVIDQINSFAYGDPVDLLNTTEGFHVFGFIPDATGEMNINTDLKAFEYLTKWKIVCMPMAT